MSALLGLFLPSGEEMEERMRREGSVYRPPASTFEGLGSAVATAPFSGMEKLYRFFSDPWGKQGASLEYDLDLEATGSVGQFFHTAVEDMTIFATGSLFGTAMSGNPLAGSALGLLGIASARGHQETEALRRKGVSENVAMIGGAVSGGFHALGFVVPFTRKHH